jgi:hypothetical protein
MWDNTGYRGLAGVGKRGPKKDGWRKRGESEGEVLGCLARGGRWFAWPETEAVVGPITRFPELKMKSQ